jgi:hypothetical protein
MAETVKEMALEERKFLHDLSNQLVVAQGMGNIALKKIKNEDKNQVDPNVVEKLEKSLRAVDKMIVLVKERRTTLHSVSM